ncbi:AfsR/SARP family transcriptional regulator [Micromonospora sp. RP3T]|uniref:AfsR/SARP family transcriptional regulator n=1 Tax=Micromonospora sp. RP3T TaxID=2135446 RepID=UPI0018ED849C|nr:AfsR/SARP family transcriptional regulator [Micromonospora sp. RP3T]
MMDKKTVTLRLLGPVSACLNDQPVMPSAPKQRQILVLLALNAGRVVTVQTLVEELWGDTPPRSFATTLQTYILQLRGRLGEAAGDRGWARQLLRTKHAGYQLDAQLCATDVAEFSGLVREGRRAAEAGDPAGTSELLGIALAMWHGPAMVDLPVGRVLRAEVASLEETRLSALERRIEADLILRRHADLLAELTMLVDRYPMNESFCALLMAALYRSGRAGHALEAFRRMRTVLREELGVEPGPRLQGLHQAILAGDPDAEPAWFVVKPVHGRRSGRAHPQRPVDVPESD